MQILRLVTLCSLVLCLVVFANAAYAQSSNGSVVGTITDPTGSVIANANVTLVNNATSDKMTSPVSQSGEYQFLIVPPGEYTLTVEAQGFKKFTQNPVEVQVAL